MRIRNVFVPLVLAPAVFAQAGRDAAPLKYWPAPLYWQPSAAEHALTESESGARFSAEAAQESHPAQTPANSLVFVGMTPCRVADTRAGFGFTGSFGPPSLVAGATRPFPVQASTTCSIPSIAQAYSFNLTVVTSKFLNYLTIWPVGATQPNASTLNDDLGTVVANAAIVPAGNDMSGSVNVFVSDNTDLIIDINGYYAAQSGITLASGSAAAPSLSFSGDAGTGIYSAGTNTVNITTGGTAAVTILPTGDVDIPGSILKNGTLFLHNLGVESAAVGINALASNSGASINSAIGYQALENNTGESNTASGANALSANTSGGSNTASGYQALSSNTTGNYNTANGYQALAANNADNNTADGYQALSANTTGTQNSASGYGALSANTTGSNNTAGGYQALHSNTTGSNNVAHGDGALSANTTGMNNIAIGYQAASAVAGGNSNNIHIGNAGASADNGAIRIGSGQTAFYAAGVSGVTTSLNNAVPVMIDTNGQLGTVSSSARFKEDIHDMGEASDGLFALRPVTFRYRQPYTDGSKPIDYGLIAEEVAEVYPDLVVKGADGQIETVQYQKLTPMLLNELEKQVRQTRQQAALIEKQAAKIERQSAQLGEQAGRIEQQRAAIERQAAEIERQSEMTRELEVQLAAVRALLK